MPVPLIRGGAVALLTAACVPDGPLEIELGTGEVDFEPLADGDEIDVINGPQGGFHVLGSVRARFVETGDPNALDDPRHPRIVFSLVHDGTEYALPAFSDFTSPMDEAAEAPWTHAVNGRLVVLDITDDDELADLPVTLSVTVEELAGDTVTDRRELTAVRWPFNP